MEVLAGSESKGVTAVLRICVALALVLRRGKQEPSEPESYASAYAHTRMHVDIPGDDDLLMGLEHSIHDSAVATTSNGRKIDTPPQLHHIAGSDRCISVKAISAKTTPQRAITANSVIVRAS